MARPDVALVSHFNSDGCVIVEGHHGISEGAACKNQGFLGSHLDERKDS